MGTGFDDAMLRRRSPQLKKRDIARAPFADPPRGYAAKGAHWIRPELVVEIAFPNGTRDGALGHPSFQGLRPDKRAAEVVREKAADSVEPAKKVAVKKVAATKRVVATKKLGASKKAAPSVIAGGTLSNPRKPYLPEAGITKADVAAYYEVISEQLLPHVVGRPL